MGESQNQNPNKKNQSVNLRDPMDPINHICEVFGDFLRCLDQHANATECLLTLIHLQSTLSSTIFVTYTSWRVVFLVIQEYGNLPTFGVK